MKTGNRARRDPAEEREASRGENRWPETWEGALNPTNLSTNRQRIANLARTKRETALCSLHHVIDLDWIKEAYRLTRKDGAPGIDGVTAADYEANPEANLSDLLGPPRGGRGRDPRGQSAGPAGAHPAGPLPCAAGAPGLHPESGRHATAARHPDLRRQGGATRVSTRLTRTRIRSRCKDQSTADIRSRTCRAKS